MSTAVSHDLDHLRQLLAAIETDLYPRIGGYRGLYPPPFPAAPSADDGQLPPRVGARWIGLTQQGGTGLRRSQTRPAHGDQAPRGPGRQCGAAQAPAHDSHHRADE